MPFALLYNLMIILVAGLIAGIVSKRLGIPMVIGYLLAGAIIGEGGIPGILMKTEEIQDEERTWSFTSFFLDEEDDEAENEDLIETDAAAVNTTKNTTVTEVSGTGSNTAEILRDNITPGQKGSPIPQQITITETAKEKIDAVVGSKQFQTALIDELAHVGALFLLFSIGIQFAPSQLVKMKKFLFIGGPLQMCGVILPIVGISYLWFHDWRTGFLLGCAASLSSTVLVFKSLEEYGQATSPLGLRAVAILLFQDIAIAPILLLLPMVLAGPGEVGGAGQIVMLVIKTLIFLAIIIGIRFLFTRRGIIILQQMRSVELTILFTVVLLFFVCMVARQLDLPSALGAFAAGVALSETRLTQQISALTVPFRETFSAIFFVSLGALFDIRILIDHPLPTVGLLIGMLMLKTAAGAIAFRILGLSSPSSAALGLGIAQLGELSFIILQDGTFKTNHPDLYQQMLFVALLSIILTPLFLKITLYYILRRGGSDADLPQPAETSANSDSGSMKGKTALVIGMGPIGRRITSYLELSGVKLCLIDMNPINLQTFAQTGFRTLAGDASDTETLKKAKITSAELVVITVPDDSLTQDIVAAVRRLNSDCFIAARCRYTGTVAGLKKAGANISICEESEAGNSLISAIEPVL